MPEPRIFITSDLHLGHTNIIKYCDRPFASADEMNKALIEKWNNTVNSMDRVFFLGDFGLGSRDKIIEWGRSLNGRKIMVYGNHDHLKPKDYINAGFEQVSKWPIVIQKQYVLSHAPLIDEVDIGRLINIYGHVHDNIDADKVITENSACVCVEWWDYRPVELETLKQQIRKRSRRR